MKAAISVANSTAGGEGDSMANMIRGAESAPSSIASVNSMIALSAPQALAARATGRSHVWQIAGPASAGKTATTSRTFNVLNNMTIFAKQAMDSMMPEKEMNGAIAGASKKLLGPLYDHAGIKVDHDKWAKDFTESSRKLFNSPNAPKLGSLSEADRPSFEDMKGLLSIQQAYPAPGASDSTRMQTVKPDAPFTVIDDLFSVAPEEDQHGYTRFMNRLGDAGLSTASFALTHNFDEQMMDKFFDTFHTEGTQDRSGLMSTVGGKDPDFVHDSMRTNHDLMSSMTDVNILNNVLSADSREGDPEHLTKNKEYSQSLLNKSVNAARNPVAAESSLANLTKSMRGISGTIGTENTANILDTILKAGPEKLHDITSIEKNGKSTRNDISGLIEGAMSHKYGVENTTAKKLAQSLSSSLNDYRATNGFNADRVAQNSHDTNKFQAALLFGDTEMPEKAKTETPSRAKAKRQKARKEMKKSIAEASTNIEHQAMKERLDPAHAKEQLKSGNDHSRYSSYGMGEVLNNSKICKIRKKGNVKQTDAPISGDANDTVVLDQEAMQNSRTMAQYDETMGAAKSYIKDPTEAKNFGRDMTISMFGLTPGAHALMKKNGLYAGSGGAEIKDLPGLLTHENAKINDAKNPTQDDIEKVADFITNMGKIEDQGTVQPQSINKKLNDMLDGLVSKKGINKQNETGLKNMEDIMTVLDGNKSEVVKALKAKADTPEALAESSQHLGTLNQLLDKDFKPNELNDKSKKDLAEYRKEKICKDKGSIPSKAKNAKAQHMDGKGPKFAQGMNNSRLLRGLGIA